MIYSANRTNLGQYSSDEIVANESYNHQTGLSQIMIENYQNDQAIFEAVVASDLSEVAQKNGIAIDESFILEGGDFVATVKKYIMILWEKIKGIFKSFLAKLDSVIMRDNKEFVKKYKDRVVGKDLSKMKYKWSKCKGGDTPKLAFNADKVASLCAETVRSARSGANGKSEKLEYVESEDFLNDVLKDVTGLNDISTFAKDAHEDSFEDVETVDGLEKTRLFSIMEVLTTSKGTIKAIKDMQNASDKYYRDQLKAVDAVIKTSTDTAVKNKEDNGNIGNGNLFRTCVSRSQIVINKVIAAVMDANKFHIKQCRRVFAQAAAHNPKSVRENAILVEAIGESAEFELNALFEDYSA